MPEAAFISLFSRSFLTKLYFKISTNILKDVLYKMGVQEVQIKGKSADFICGSLSLRKHTELKGIFCDLSLLG